MPFSEYRSPVADLLQELGKGHLLGIEAVPVTLESVLVAVLPRQDTGPTWSADRIGTEVRLEQGSFSGNPIYVRSTVDFRTVSRDGLSCVIIGKDEDDVGFGLTQPMPDAKHENTKRETEELHDLQDEDFERLINTFRTSLLIFVFGS
jgi:hypothetical protein